MFFLNVELNFFIRNINRIESKAINESGQCALIVMAGLHKTFNKALNTIIILRLKK